MKAQVIRLTLLNHLFYYTEVAGGNASATLTGAFLGDLALNYALQRVMSGGTDTYDYRAKPNYAQIAQFGFYCTVAKPLGMVKRTEIYINNTLFNCDGYVDVDSIMQSGKSPYKNYRQVQGIAAGTTFIAAVLSNETLKLPPTIRMGRAKETLLKIETLPEKEYKDQDFWLNAYTLATVYQNLPAAIELMKEQEKVNFAYILENYNLLKKLTLPNVMQIFDGKLS
ncbi:type I-D CRISPR-associated protein Cas5/Csc1 [Sphingobacteriales bacterium UPWRP_1]|nr:type I-D CRISPR-associated protein Cas5/Csc1 [Sphingobacteriales bacterium TSM_CSS]PSJ75947.1 type I-D CRISPR-associated protein Cas5/Csc1 [Sphingobacteriales bacterium UPWRP_1]